MISMTCPSCGHPGPHQPIPNSPYLECGRRPTRVGPRTFIGGCGWSWHVEDWSDAVLGPDPVANRLVDLIDDTPIAVIDDETGGERLTWECEFDLVRRLAADSTLAALMAEQQLGGAA
jgi:hypothetical protein